MLQQYLCSIEPFETSRFHQRVWCTNHPTSLQSPRSGRGQLVDGWDSGWDQSGGPPPSLHLLLCRSKTQKRQRPQKRRKLHGGSSFGNFGRAFFCVKQSWVYSRVPLAKINKITAFQISSKAKAGTFPPIFFPSQVPIWLVHS